MDIVAVIVLGAIGSLIAAEVYANAEVFADFLIRRAILRLPEQKRLRFLEEWRADNKDFAGSIQKVIHAVGCYIGASAVAKVLSTPRPSRHSSGSEIVKSNKTEQSKTTTGRSVAGHIRVGRLKIDEKTIKRLAELEKSLSKNTSADVIRAALKLHDSLKQPEFRYIRNYLTHLADDREIRTFSAVLKKKLSGND